MVDLGLADRPGFHTHVGGSIGSSLGSESRQDYLSFADQSEPDAAFTTSLQEPALIRLFDEARHR